MSYDPTLPPVSLQDLLAALPETTEALEKYQILVNAQGDLCRFRASNGIWYGTQAELDALDPALRKGYQEWLLSGAGYFEFHVFPSQGLTFAGATALFGLSAGTPGLFVQRTVAGAGFDLAFSAGLPEVRAVRLAAGERAELGLTAYTPEVNILALGEIMAETADLSLNAGTPLLLASRLVEGCAAAMAMEAGAPGVAASRLVDAVSAGMALGAGASSVLYTGVVAAATASLGLGAAAPGASRTFVVAGVSAALGIGTGVSVAKAIFKVTGITSSLALATAVPAVKEIFRVAGATGTMAVQALGVSTVTKVSNASAHVTTFEAAQVMDGWEVNGMSDGAGTVTVGTAVRVASNNTTPGGSIALKCNTGYWDDGEAQDCNGGAIGKLITTPGGAVSFNALTAGTGRIEFWRTGTPLTGGTQLGTVPLTGGGTMAPYSFTIPAGTYWLWLVFAGDASLDIYLDDISVPV